VLQWLSAPVQAEAKRVSLRTGVAFSHVIASGIAMSSPAAIHHPLSLSLSLRQLSTASASTIRDDDLVAPRNSCAAHAAFSVFILQLFKSSYGVLLYRTEKLEIGVSSRADKQLPDSSDISRMDRRMYSFNCCPCSLDDGQRYPNDQELRI
jgi:hypothetical protein